MEDTNRLLSDNESPTGKDETEPGSSQGEPVKESHILESSRARIKTPLPIDPNIELQYSPSSPKNNFQNHQPALQEPYRHARTESFHNTTAAEFSFPSENKPLGHPYPSALGTCRPLASSSTSSLRNISCTPTTENLARRMALSRKQTHSATNSESGLDYPGQGPTDQPSALASDGSYESSRESESNPTDSPRTRAFSKENSLTKTDLISYLPEIPATRTSASEEERLAKWGLHFGPPQGGSTYRNPHNYEVIGAYFEDEDHPMYNVAESTRRAGNAAIQSLFDPLYAMPGVDGRIPRGFPLYGFAMREMPSTNLHEVLQAYNIEPIHGPGYDIDRQNMALLCTHLGATWLASVI